MIILVQVHRKIREDSDMAQDSLQCLAQLASMHGPVFPDESAQISYLAHLVEGLLSMINGSVARLLLLRETNKIIPLLSEPPLVTRVARGCARAYPSCV